MNPLVKDLILLGIMAVASLGFGVIIGLTIFKGKLLDNQIRIIIDTHYERLSAILYNEYGYKYITSWKAEKPPDGYMRVKGYVRRKPEAVK